MMIQPALNDRSENKIEKLFGATPKNHGRWMHLILGYPKTSLRNCTIKAKRPNRIFSSQLKGLRISTMSSLGQGILITSFKVAQGSGAMAEMTSPNVFDF